MSPKATLAVRFLCSGLLTEALFSHKIELGFGAFLNFMCYVR